MTEELSFEAYLGLSQKKFEIYLLDKKSLKNIYKEEVHLKNIKIKLVLITDFNISLRNLQNLKHLLINL